jgi:hypothetical protein
MSDLPTGSPRRDGTDLREAVASQEILLQKRRRPISGRKKARCQADTGLGRRAPQRPEASTRRNVGGAFGGLPFQAPDRNVNPSRSLPFAIRLVLQPRHGSHSSPENVCRPTRVGLMQIQTREPFGRFTEFFAVVTGMAVVFRIAEVRISGFRGTARIRRIAPPPGPRGPTVGRWWGWGGSPPSRPSGDRAGRWCRAGRPRQTCVPN